VSNLRFWTAQKRIGVFSVPMSMILPNWSAFKGDLVFKFSDPCHLWQYKQGQASSVLGHVISCYFMLFHLPPLKRIVLVPWNQCEPMAYLIEDQPLHQSRETVKPPVIKKIKNAPERPLGWGWCSPSGTTEWHGRIAGVQGPKYAHQTWTHRFSVYGTMYLNLLPFLRCNWRPVQLCH
jgi:hypothetical protein